MARREEAHLSNGYIKNYVLSFEPATYKDIAQKSGLSRPTISEVFNNNQFMSPSVLSKVLHAYPPRTWDEMCNIMSVWMPENEARMKKTRRIISEQKILYGKTEGGQQLTALKNKYDLASNAELARLLGVSKVRISHIAKSHATQKWLEHAESMLMNKKRNAR